VAYEAADLLLASGFGAVIGGRLVRDPRARFIDHHPRASLKVEGVHRAAVDEAPYARLECGPGDRGRWWDVLPRPSGREHCVY
jgi:hypothetical protein